MSDSLYNLGLAFEKRKSLSSKTPYDAAITFSNEAIKEYEATLRINPNSVDAHISLGQSFARKGMLNESIKEFMEAVKIKWNYAKAHFNLGIAFAMKGLMNEAINEFKETLKMDPTYPDARISLEPALKEKGIDKKQASEHFSRAYSLYKKGFLDDAIKEYREMLKIKSQSRCGALQSWNYSA